MGAKRGAYTRRGIEANAKFKRHCRPLGQAAGEAYAQPVKDSAKKVGPGHPDRHQPFVRHIESAEPVEHVKTTKERIADDLARDEAIRKGKLRGVVSCSLNELFRLAVEEGIRRGVIKPPGQ